MIDLAQFRRALLKWDGQRFETQSRRRGFVLRVYAEGPEYIPESTGEPRPDSWSSVQRVLDRFNESGSLRPTDYHEITHHSSYVLALLAAVAVTRSRPATDKLDPPDTELLLEEGAQEPNQLRTGAVDLPPPEDTAAKPHQRVGSVSNAHVGSDFELVALEHFRKQGVQLRRDYAVEVGLSTKKLRRFDLGSAEHKILVECKSHKWTSGGRVPSAKMTVWNEAMFYFFLAPPEYRKVLFVLHDRREGEGESLLSYYKRTHGHMIPEGVEFLEWDELSGDVIRI